MNRRLNPLTPSIVSVDADYKYPCFKMEEVERALVCMTGKLGFHRVQNFDLPAVFTFEFDDLRLMVMTTPKVFYSDRLCYAFSGVLIKSDEWATEVASLGHEENQNVSTWRKHPKDFYQDLLDAVANLRPDMCLPEGKQKLLGPVVTLSSSQVKPPVQRLTCIEWQA